MSILTGIEVPAVTRNDNTTILSVRGKLHYVDLNDDEDAFVAWVAEDTDPDVIPTVYRLAILTEGGSMPEVEPLEWKLLALLKMTRGKVRWFVFVEVPATEPEPE